MKTIKGREGQPSTHYVTHNEWNFSYMANKPLIEHMEVGDIVIMTMGSASTIKTVESVKQLKDI